MTDLRSLLIDCRIELRKLSRDFQKTELCERLDLAIQAQANAKAAPALAAAAAGAATFTREQREWCVGEAMVLTGFQFTPVELLEKGDSHIAKLILQARPGA